MYDSYMINQYLDMIGIDLYINRSIKVGAAREIMATTPICIMLNHTPSRMASFSLLGLLISHVFIVTRNCSAFHLPTTPSVRVCGVEVEVI